MKLLPRISNEVFLDKESARNVEFRPFDLHQDLQYGFYFNNAFTEAVYDPESYQNEQSLSPTFRKHLDDFIGILKDKFGVFAKIVEVGCGKGSFMKLLSEKNFSNLRGFDKTYQGDNSNIVKDYLTKDYFPLGADVIVLRHVLEHVPDPINFLLELEAVNGKQCFFAIEVPSMEWNLRAKAYWDFGYEHVNYFTKESFHKIFNECEASEVFGGQYLLVIASSLTIVRRKTQNSEPSSLYMDLLDDAFNENPINDIGTSGARYWVWGAGGKGVLALFHLEQFGVEKFMPPLGVVDINPAKQGRFMVSSGAEVVSAEYFFARAEDGDFVLIANPIYENEIKEYIQKNCDKKISFRLF